MADNEIVKILDFIKEAERIKDTLRTSHTSKGRSESVAEHTWRLCLLAMVVHEKYFPALDFSKLIKICIIHDLGEAFSGDIPATQQTGTFDKSNIEREDLKRLLSTLPNELINSLMELWEDYESAKTEEAKLAKALDKLETLIQHNQGDNPKDFDYAFNLNYGRKYTQFNEIIEEIRGIIDLETKENMKGN